MRTAQLLRKFDPAEWGGTEMALQRLFDGLREQGVSCVVYCPRLKEAVEDPLVSSGYEVQRFKAFVPVLGMPDERKRQLIAVGGNLMSFDLISSLWRAPELSLIHTHTLGRIGGIARTIAKTRGLPFVITIHGGVMDLPQKVKETFNAPNSSGWEWGKLFGLLFQSHNLFRDADAIVTCNEKEAALLRERFPEKRIQVQPHGVPVPIYQQDHREAARKAYPEINGRKIILSLGRVDPIKNQGWLLDQAPEIFARYPEALLVFIGACTDEPYGRMIHEKIDTLALRGRVLLTGGLAPADPRLLGLLQQAEVLVLPSLSETFGLVVLEAWAAGTPVISSRTSGASALILHGENGWLFDLEKPAEFHSALATAFGNEQLRREMTARGTEKVLGQYSVEALAGKMRGLYEQLAEEKACVT